MRVVLLTCKPVWPEFGSMRTMAWENPNTLLHTRTAELDYISNAKVCSYNATCQWQISSSYREGRKTASNTLWAVIDRCRRLAVRLTEWRRRRPWPSQPGAAAGVEQHKQTNTPQAKRGRLASTTAGWKPPEEGVSLDDLNGFDHLRRAAASDPDDDANMRVCTTADRAQTHSQTQDSTCFS